MEATTFVQSRAKTALVMLGLLVFIGLGAWMLNDPDGTLRYSPEELHAIGAMGVVIFGLGALLVAAQLLWPSRLILSPSGLTYMWIWRRRTWAWRDLGPFTIEEGAKGIRRIRFEVTSPSVVLFPFGQDGSQTLPDVWTSEIKQVCAELDAARHRWS